MTKDYIKTAIDTLCNYCYDELYVYVDFVEESEECSFGSDPVDPLNTELVGDIEIGVDLDLEHQYYALIHETGHALLHLEESESSDTVLLEAQAWCEGLNAAKKLGLRVNESKLREQMMHALFSLNHKELLDYLLI